MHKDVSKLIYPDPDVKPPIVHVNNNFDSEPTGLHTPDSILEVAKTETPWTAETNKRAIEINPIKFSLESLQSL